MTKNERVYLNNLSKLLYGSSTRWTKMVNKGEIAELTEKLEDGTERKYKGVSRYTVEEVKKTMEELWQEEQDNQAKKEVESNVVNQTEQIG